MDKQLAFLFVCSGNTCRSVMAQGFFSKIWEESGKQGTHVEVCSAGMETVDGLGATGEALQVLRDEGVELSHHRSRRINDLLVKNADYIFTMTRVQKETLLEHFPAARGKVWKLSEFAGPGNLKEINDPFGRGLQQYRLTAEEIKKAIGEIVNKLRKPEGEKSDREN